MNVDSVVGYQPSATPASRVAKGEPRADEKPAADNNTSTQFAALLALLAGNGHKVRANLMDKAAPGDVALLDRLLNGTLVSDDADAIANGNATTEAHAAATLDAVRYGMMNDIAGMVIAPTPKPSPANVTVPTGTNTTDIKVGATAANIASSTNATARAETAPAKKNKPNEALLAGLARALESGKTGAELTARSPKRSASVEELMARGDTRAANTRVMIDTLLSKAGTPEGSAIADNSAALAMAGTNAAELLAFVSSLAAARAASAADTSTPVTDTSALMPELRSKLDRVIARMQTEYGHDVQVVETARSPERQTQLYAQGRTTPGSVVTWTLDSAHIRGAAADVVVDGSWNNPKGFARLQQIAREEGLRTLGAKDPGHLELMNTDTDVEALANTLVRNTTQTLMSNAKSSSGDGASGVARVANVAGVAGIAQVAVAAQSSNVRTEESAPNTQDRNAANISLGVLAESANRGAAGDSSGNAKREDQQSGAREGIRERSRDTKQRDGAVPAYVDAQNAYSANTPSTTTTERPAAAAGASSAERVADANALRENAPAKPVSQMTLEVEGPNGTAQKITVDMRGNTVSTHIATDAESADRMRARVGDLQGALEQHGLQSDAVRITAPGARPADAADQVKQAASQGERDALRLAGAAASNAGDGASQQGLRDRPGTARDWEKHNDARNARDEQRQGSGQRNRRGPNQEEL